MRKVNLILLGFLTIALAIMFFGETQELKQLGAAVCPSLNTFTAGTTIVSADVNSNFTNLRTAVNEINSSQILDATIAAADCASGFIVNSLISATADITPSKILMSGAISLDDWQHASDGEKIDGADIYDGSIPGFEAGQDSEVASDTVTETSWHDIAGSEVSKTLAVTSNVMVYGTSIVGNSAAGICYLRVVYDTTSVADAGTQIGQDSYVDSKHAYSGQIGVLPCMAGGVVPSLAAGTYDFKLQAKVNTGTGTYLKNNISILAIPE